MANFKDLTQLYSALNVIVARASLAQHDKQMLVDRIVNDQLRDEPNDNSNTPHEERKAPLKEEVHNMKMCASELSWTQYSRKR